MAQGNKYKNVKQKLFVFLLFQMLHKKTTEVDYSKLKENLMQELRKNTNYIACLPCNSA